MKSIQCPWAKFIQAFAISSLCINAVAAEEEAKQTKEEDFERIEVVGYRWFPEAVGLTGRYDLSREFLDYRSQGNGNITDMLTFLPGVQVSEDSFAVEQQAEIRSQLISISGAKPWQTGFYLDGMSNNSRIDPNSSNRSPSSINDVQGHPQAFFVNQALVGKVTVYDSNIPARFSGFSGGVVDVESRDAEQTPWLKINWRTSKSDWNQYQYIDNRADLQEEPEDYEPVEVELPDFSKQTVSVTGSIPLAPGHSVMLSASKTTSEIGEISLLEPVTTKRDSVSAMLSYNWTDGWFDKLSASVSYSPYEGDYILTDIKDSDFSLEGGGRQAKVSIEDTLGDWSISSSLGYSYSENSRSAFPAFRPWYRAAGKDWGIDSGGTPFSVEGGYGNLDKTQTSGNWNTDAQYKPFQWIGANHDLSLGFSAQSTTIERLRNRTGLVYNGPYRDANIDCRGYNFDCIEQSYHVPLDELADSLGGNIDLSNPEHLQAYSENLKTRGQFFRYRRVYPIENISVEMKELSAYVDDAVEWDNLRLRLGLRADYNDFLENIDIAPRIQLGYDLFGNGDSLLTAGVNRYYDANLITYKLREARRPYITQLRSINAGVVGDWQTSNEVPRFRYLFNNVSTPYSDEFSLAWKQRFFGGLLSLKGVKRWQRDQLARGDSFEEDGLTFVEQVNGGKGTYERLTLSYQYRWNQHEFWFHTSWSDNLTSSESYDSGVDLVPEDEIVALRSARTGSSRDIKLISQDDLTRLNEDFSRPLTANFSLHSEWTEALRTSVNISYQGAYESAVNTQSFYQEDKREVCTDCGDIDLAYPLFVQTELPARTLINTAIHYDVPLFDRALQLTLEVDNLLNSRTHHITYGQAGIETGRSYWVGFSYTMD